MKTATNVRTNVKNQILLSSEFEQIRIVAIKSILFPCAVSFRFCVEEHSSFRSFRWFFADFDNKNAMRTKPFNIRHTKWIHDTQRCKAENTVKQQGQRGITAFYLGRRSYFSSTKSPTEILHGIHGCLSDFSVSSFLSFLIFLHRTTMCIMHDHCTPYFGIKTKFRCLQSHQGQTERRYIHF